ncbi:hypothetical protein [Haloparvum sp. AD34]
MADYSVFIWETETLYNNYGTTPAERTQTYIEGAFEHTSKSVATYLFDPYPQMYEDDENESQWQYEQQTLDGKKDVSTPCKSGTTDYNGIGYYFMDWLRDCESTLDSADFHVLLTAAEDQNGHTIHWNDGSVCVVEGGPFIPDAPTTFTRYEPKDDGTAEGIALDAIQTVHHELGHALLHDDEDAHRDHEMGAVTKYDGNYEWVTPLGLNEGTTNECGETFTRETYRRWDLVWSDCCVSYWESDPS